MMRLGQPFRKAAVPRAAIPSGYMGASFRLAAVFCFVVLRAFSIDSLLPAGEKRRMIEP